jgi:hypothetical protein
MSSEPAIETIETIETIEDVDSVESEHKRPRPKPPQHVRVPAETIVGNKPIDDPAHELKTEPKVKAPQPPFPLPGGPKPHAPLAPPPRTPAPRAATLIGIEAPPTGRYRLSATESDDVVSPSAAAPKVIINAGAEAVPKVRPEVATVNVGSPRQAAPKTAVRVAAKSMSVAELWRDPGGEETTNPGVGHHAMMRPPRRVDLPREELKLLADFAVQLSLGPVSGLWLMEAKPAVAVLKNAAFKHELKDLTAALERLELALVATPGQRIEGDTRQRLLGDLKLLEHWLPTSKDLETEKNDRERLILDQLMAQISGIHPSSRRRLEDRGYASLDRLRGASVDVLVQELDLSHQHAEGLLAAFHSYYDDRVERPPVAGRGRERCVNDALTVLERSATEFDLACDGEDSERKRSARKQRAQAVASVNLLLAELGENELLDQMVRCSVQERVERLRQWLGTTSLGSQSSVQL